MAQTDSEVIGLARACLKGVRLWEFILCILKRLCRGSKGILKDCKIEYTKGFTPIFNFYNDLSDIF